jgi:hypothetical protein
MFDKKNSLENTGLFGPTEGPRRQKRVWSRDVRASRFQMPAPRPIASEGLSNNQPKAHLAEDLPQFSGGIPAEIIPPRPTLTRLLAPPLTQNTTGSTSRSRTRRSQQS